MTNMETVDVAEEDGEGEEEEEEEHDLEEGDGGEEEEEEGKDKDEANEVRKGDCVAFFYYIIIALCVLYVL